MRVAIHQPNYIPYPGFFAKLYLSDVFVIYDTAQFTRGGFINRNRIRTFSLNGWIWLTLPVGKKNFKGVDIKHVKITDKNVFNKHSRTLTAMYSRAPFFDKEVCEIIETPHEYLSEHNVFIIRYLLKKLRIDHPRIILASELGISISPGTQGLIDIVKFLGGDEYLSGIGAREYLDQRLFKQESISLSFLDYKPWRYNQVHPGFVENMSIVDAIFCIGFEEAASKLKETKFHRVIHF